MLNVNFQSKKFSRIDLSRLKKFKAQRKWMVSFSLPSGRLTCKCCAGGIKSNQSIIESIQNSKQKEFTETAK